METKNHELEDTNRREMLKKVGKSAVFIAPVLMSFNISEVNARISGKPTLPNEPDPPAQITG